MDTETRTRTGVGLIAVVTTVVLILAVATTGSPRTVRVTQLHVQEDLLNKLLTLAGGLHNEVVLCLQGTVSGDTAYASDFVMPTPRLSSPLRSISVPCPDGTLATWHNHPQVQLSEVRGEGGTWSSPRLEDSDEVARAEQLCALSRDDIQTSARLDHPFVVIGVDADTWCWWSRFEVESLLDLGVPVGFPAPDRLLAETGDSAP